MAGERIAMILAQNHKGAPASSFLFGEVKQTKPLEVSVDDLPTLKEAMLIVGKNCTEDGGLKKGDKVFIIRSNDGQRFYLAERLTK